MHLDDYVQRVQQQLTDAASLGGEEVQRVAAGLAAAADSAIRLAVMQALADAADEITAALLDVPTAPAIAMRLDGDTVRADVTPGVPVSPDAGGDRTDTGEATARISLRLSEQLKSDVEAAATRDGISVNTWLVRAAAVALGSGRSWAEPRHHTGHRISGFING
jgi:hypothetical protein